MGEDFNYNSSRLKSIRQQCFRIWKQALRPSILYFIEQPFLFLFFLIAITYKSLKFLITALAVLTELALVIIRGHIKAVFKNSSTPLITKRSFAATTLVLTLAFTLITVNKNNETNAVVNYNFLTPPSTAQINNITTENKIELIKSPSKVSPVKTILTLEPVVKIKEIPKKPDLKITPPDIIRFNKNNKNLSITFDGGSNSSETEKILKTLRKHSVKTTIFLSGAFIKNFPELVTQMVEDGHEIGNHTLRHKHITNFSKTKSNKSLPYVTENFIKKELHETNILFKKLTGTDMAPIWRAPFGEINEEVRHWAYKAGFIHINWTRGKSHDESLDTLDWVSDKDSHLYMTSTEIANKVIKFALTKEKINGGIILMHLGTNRKSDKGSSGLSYIISSLQSMGYNFTKVTTLIKEDNRYSKYLKGYAYLAKPEKVDNTSIASIKK